MTDILTPERVAELKLALLSNIGWGAAMTRAERDILLALIAGWQRMLPAQDAPVSRRPPAVDADALKAFARPKMRIGADKTQYGTKTNALPPGDPRRLY